MKFKISTALILLAISLSLNTAGALPPPCSPEELLNSSQYAVQGEVLKVYCGEPYNSNECRPDQENDTGFEPELYSNCSATIMIIDNLKGNHKAGTKVVIPYVRVAKQCSGGTRIIPGSPTYELVAGEQIKYYKSAKCRYWNIQELQQPGSAQ